MKLLIIANSRDIFLNVESGREERKFRVTFMFYKSDVIWFTYTVSCIDRFQIYSWYKIGKQTVAKVKIQVWKQVTV